MAQVLIRDLDEKVVAKLKKRAARNKRSLQAELLDIVERAASFEMEEDPYKLAERIRRRLAAEGRYFSDSAELIAEDRRR